jgi:hypothetical protein
MTSSDGWEVTAVSSELMKKKLSNSSRWWLQDALRKAKAQGKVGDGL